MEMQTSYENSSSSILQEQGANSWSTRLPEKWNCPRPEPTKQELKPKRIARSDKGLTTRLLASSSAVFYAKFGRVGAWLGGVA
jgi:hypothetical protein